MRTVVVAIVIIVRMVVIVVMPIGSFAKSTVGTNVVVICKMSPSVPCHAHGVKNGR